MGRPGGRLPVDLDDVIADAPTMAEPSDPHVSLSEERRDYTQRELLEEEVVGKDPHDLVQQWLASAVQAKVPDATAMSLATVDERGWPDVRVVLLKGLSSDGWDFFTNYDSQKVRHLDRAPHMGAAVLYWPLLERQVRVVGSVRRLDRERSEAYFRSRPRASQLGAWASPQSQPIDGREVLDLRYAELAQQYPEGAEIPMPPFWGGLRLQPVTYEFWQGRRNRLHDRFRVTRDQGEGWRWGRLAP